MGFHEDLPQIPVYGASESTRSLRDAEPQAGSCLHSLSEGLLGPGSAWTACDPCLPRARGSMGAAVHRQDLITGDDHWCCDEAPTGGTLVSWGPGRLLRGGFKKKPQESKRTRGPGRGQANEAEKGVVEGQKGCSVAARGEDGGAERGHTNQSSRLSADSGFLPKDRGEHRVILGREWLSRSHS